MPRIKMCSKCQSEISEFQQAYSFKGDVVCHLCHQRLRQGAQSPDVEPEELSFEAEVDSPLSPPVAPAYAEIPVSSEPSLDLTAAKKKREKYLMFFVGVIVGNAFLMGRSPIGYLIYFPCWIAFLCYFLSACKHVGGYSTGARIAIGVGLFVPVVSLIILLVIDSRLYKRVREMEAALQPEKTLGEFCSMGLYSLLLFMLPYIGLPLGIFALRRISKSEGRLTGKSLAVFSIVLNAVVLAFHVFLIIMAVLR